MTLANIHATGNCKTCGPLVLPKKAVTEALSAATPSAPAVRDGHVVRYFRRPTRSRQQRLPDDDDELPPEETNEGKYLAERHQYRFDKDAEYKMEQRSLPGIGKELENKFDLVVFHSPEARSMFCNLMNDFLCPDEEENVWPEIVRAEWYRFKWDCADGLLEIPNAGKPFKYLPVAAMVEAAPDGLPFDLPCAAAQYSLPSMNDKNTYVLEGVIRNRWDRCRGGGAAIVCNLIKSSKNKSGSFSPLQVVRTSMEYGPLRYFESFGCEVIDEYTLECPDPDPEKCWQYAKQDEFRFTAREYFELPAPTDFTMRDRLMSKRRLSASAFGDVKLTSKGVRTHFPSCILVTALSCVCTCSGLLFLGRLYRRASTAMEQPLLNV